MANTAVVILNYNGLDYLKQFLPSVIANSGNCRIVVIDNQSSDQSVSFLQNNFPEVRIVQLRENYGFSGGYNRGLLSVDADYMILLNSDVQVPPDWTDDLIQYFEKHPHVGICQPKILSHQDPKCFDYAGAAGGFMDILGYPFCRGRMFDTLEQDLGQYNEDRLIFWAGGACLAIRKDLFEQLGGFDEDFFAHMEEIDLCWRSQLLGAKVAFVASSEVYHVGGGTLASTNPLKTFLNFRNALSILLKNAPLGQILWKLPLRILLDGITAVRFLINGSWGHFWAVLRADVAFLGLIPRMWGKRRKRGKIPVKLYPKSVVWNYFILGNKTFQNLESS